MEIDRPARIQLLELLRRHAVLRGEFVLSSGDTSSYYLDARRVTLSATGSALVGECLFYALRPHSIDGVAGLTVGADPIVTAIGVTSAWEHHPLDAFIVRKQTKEHGVGRRIEGPWRDRLRLAVVDDTLTTGASCLEAARAVAEAGATVAGVWCLIDREQGAREAIEAAGYLFTALFTAGDVLAGC